MPNMRAGLLNSNYLKLLWGIFIIVILFIIFMVFYFPSYTKLKRLKEANMNLAFQIEMLNEEINSLEDKMQRVDKDPYLYEKIARDELGIAREGEIVIDVQE